MRKDEFKNAVRVCEGLCVADGTTTIFLMLTTKGVSAPDRFAFVWLRKDRSLMIYLIQDAKFQSAQSKAGKSMEMVEDLCISKSSDSADVL